MCLSSSEGSEELQSRSKLLRLLDAVTDALVWAIAKTGLSFQQQSARLAHLLMLLSHIRHVRYSSHNMATAVTLASYLSVTIIALTSYRSGIIQSPPSLLAVTI